MDGQAQRQFFNNGSLVASGHDLVIGKEPFASAGYLDGQIADLDVDDTALSDGQISDLYAAPTAVSVEALGGTAMRVVWLGGGNAAGGYDVEYRKAGDTDWTSAGTAAPGDSAFVVTGLSVGTAYEARVRAVHSAGALGTPSAVAAVTTGPIDQSGWYRVSVPANDPALPNDPPRADPLPPGVPRLHRGLTAWQSDNGDGSGNDLIRIVNAGWVYAASADDAVYQAVTGSIHVEGSGQTYAFGKGSAVFSVGDAKTFGAPPEGNLPDVGEVIAVEDSAGSIDYDHNDDYLRVNVKKLSVGLDVDSDNNNGLAPDPHVEGDAEDSIEDDPTLPGKVMVADTGDANDNGVPDFADMASATAFVPAIIHVAPGIDPSLATFSLSYPGSDPALVVRSGSGTDADPYVYTPALGDLRLWTKDGTDNRNAADLNGGGDYLSPGTSYLLSQLPAADRLTADTWRVFIEGVTANAAGDEIQLTVNPSGAGSSGGSGSSGGTGGSSGSTTGPATRDAARVTVVPQPILRVDGNRDKFITFDAADATTAQKPYTFWLNDNSDTTGADNNVPADAGDRAHAADYEQASGLPDSIFAMISNRRDLEDFSRVQVRFDPALVYDSVEFKMTDVGATRPAVRLFRAVQSDDNYLFNNTVADRQLAIDGAIDASANLTTTISAAQFDRGRIARDGQAEADYLFEGVQAGTGALDIRFLNHGQQVGEDKVFLKLQNVNKLYEDWTVGDTAERDTVPATTATLTSDSQAYKPPVTEDDKNYLLFVHGWRLAPWERRVFAATAFKRLWWDGYKGRFGMFNWPTEWTDSVVTDPQNYDRSEFNAWRSAAGLKDLLGRLAAQYSGGDGSHVSLLAHSMGNIVASEALRLFVQPDDTKGRVQPVTKPVKTYIATQSAVAADAYDADVMHTPDRNPGLLTGFAWRTPDVYRHYAWPNNAANPAPGNAYFAHINDAAGRIVRYFNPVEPVTGGNWAANQDTKPDRAAGTSPAYSYDPDNQRWQHGNQVLSFPADKYELFAHAVQAHSDSVGHNGNAIAGPYDPTHDVDLNVQFPYGPSGPGHGFHRVALIGGGNECLTPLCRTGQLWSVARPRPTAPHVPCRGWGGNALAFPERYTDQPPGGVLRRDPRHISPDVSKIRIAAGRFPRIRSPFSLHPAGGFFTSIRRALGVPTTCRLLGPSNFEPMPSLH